MVVLLFVTSVFSSPFRVGVVAPSAFFSLLLHKRTSAFLWDNTALNVRRDITKKLIIDCGFKHFNLRTFDFVLLKIQFVHFFRVSYKMKIRDGLLLVDYASNTVYLL